MGYAEIDLIFNSSVYVTFFKLRTLNKDWICIPIIIEYVNSNIYVNHLLIIDNARCWLKLFFKTPIISMHFCFIFQTVLLLSGTIRSHLDSILKIFLQDMCHTVFHGNLRHSGTSHTHTPHGLSTSSTKKTFRIKRNL